MSDARDMVAAVAGKDEGCATAQMEQGLVWGST